MNRLGCALACAWQALWAPWDGGERGGSFGWRIAPRMGFWLDLLTCYALPFLFAGILGAAGAALGGAAMSAGLVEGAAQFFLREPYKKPISRLLVDWIPAA